MGDEGSAAVAAIISAIRKGIDLDWLKEDPMPYFGPRYSREEVVGAISKYTTIRYEDMGDNWPVAAAKSGPDNYMIRRVGVISQGKHKDGHLFDVSVSIRVIKYGGKIEFIASIRPVNEKPTIDKIPIPNIDKRRAVRQRSMRKRADK